MTGDPIQAALEAHTKIDSLLAELQRQVDAVRAVLNEIREEPCDDRRN